MDRFRYIKTQPITTDLTSSKGLYSFLILRSRYYHSKLSFGSLGSLIGHIQFYLDKNLLYGLESLSFRSSYYIAIDLLNLYVINGSFES